MTPGQRAAAHHLLEELLEETPWEDDQSGPESLDVLDTFERLLTRHRVAFVLVDDLTPAQREALDL